MSQEKLKEAMAEFDRLAEKVQNNHRNTTRLATQQNENEAVIRACWSDSSPKPLQQQQHSNGSLSNSSNSKSSSSNSNDSNTSSNTSSSSRSNAVIYKMVGPVLIRQNKTEALSTVSKRLEYVKGELQRCDKLDVEMRKQFQEAAQNVELLQKKLLDKQRQQKGRL
ncbi:hypothetical protein Emed_003270 [Eimeria media]